MAVVKGHFFLGEPRPLCCGQQADRAEGMHSLAPAQTLLSADIIKKVTAIKARIPYSPLSSTSKCGKIKARWLIPGAFCASHQIPQPPPPTALHGRLRRRRRGRGLRSQDGGGDFRHHGRTGAYDRQAIRRRERDEDRRRKEEKEERPQDRHLGQVTKALLVLYTYLVHKEFSIRLFFVAPMTCTSMDILIYTIITLAYNLAQRRVRACTTSKPRDQKHSNPGQGCNDACTEYAACNLVCSF